MRPAPRTAPLSAVLVLGVAAVEDSRWQVEWKRDMLNELLQRRAGVAAAVSGNGRTLCDWQWRLLLTRAMRNVPPSPSHRTLSGPWGKLLEAGLIRGVINRVGLMEAFRSRYPAQLVVEVPLQWRADEPLPMEIVAETPFGPTPLRIRGVSVNGEATEWQRADGAGGRGRSGGRGSGRIPDDRVALEIRFGVEMLVPARPGGTGEHVVAVRVRRVPAYGLLVAEPLWQDAELDEFVLRRLNPQNVHLIRRPSVLPTPSACACGLPAELGLEYREHEIAAMSYSVANQRYAVLSGVLQRCRLAEETKQRLWHEWRLVRGRVRQLKENGAG